MTDNLAQIVSLSGDTDKYCIHEGLKFYINEYRRCKKETNAISAAYAFSLKVEEAVDKKAQESKPSLTRENKAIQCKKGCSFCCMTTVDITDDEAELLLEAAAEQGIAIDWDKVKKQDNIKNWKKLNAQDRRCPFLAENGACNVYDYRPSVCRKLLVVTDPKRCDTIKNPGALVGRLNSADAEVLVSAIWNATQSGPMAKMLLMKR